MFLFSRPVVFRGALLKARFNERGRLLISGPRKMGDRSLPVGDKGFVWDRP
jgi:hypothetical protein